MAAQVRTNALFVNKQTAQMSNGMKLGRCREVRLDQGVRGKSEIDSE